MSKGQWAQTAQAHNNCTYHFSISQRRDVKLQFIKQNITLALQKKSDVLQILKYFEEFERKYTVFWPKWGFIVDYKINFLCQITLYCPLPDLTECNLVS